MNQERTVTHQTGNHPTGNPRTATPRSTTSQPGKGAAARRGPVSARILIDSLTEQFDSPQRVVDLGGGTGGVAADLVQQGHRVIVVDPSPDALAATLRRARENGLDDRLTAVQGDTSDLARVVEPGSVDVVLCHLVLGRVDELATALPAIGQVLAPGGRVSFVIAQRYPRLLKLALAGKLTAARELVDDTNLLDRSALLDQLSGAGFTVLREQGLGVLSDQLPESASQGQQDELMALETRVGADPAWLETASRLHVLARR